MKKESLKDLIYIIGFYKKMFDSDPQSIWVSNRYYLANTQFYEKKMCCARSNRKKIEHQKQVQNFKNLSSSLPASYDRFDSFNE